MNNQISCSCLHWDCDTNCVTNGSYNIIWLPILWLSFIIVKILLVSYKLIHDYCNHYAMAFKLYADFSYIYGFCHSKILLSIRTPIFHWLDSFCFSWILHHQLFQFEVDNWICFLWNLWHHWFRCLTIQCFPYNMKWLIECYNVNMVPMNLTSMI